MPEPDERHCRLLATHEPHVWTYRQRLESGSSIGSHIDLDQEHRCPGIAHDHKERCCEEHGTHVTPHRGCVLR